MVLDLSSDLMKQEFLDGIELKEPIPNQKVSVIIPTYNRSPHPVKEDNNPLAWSLESTLNQQKGGLDEIIVVDDGSEDYTFEVFKHFKERTDLNMVYLRNTQRAGLAASRNRGIEASRNELLFFTDDDCIFGRYVLFGGKFTLGNSESNVAAVQFPVYHRTTIPKIGPQNIIGKVLLEEGIIEGNYDIFPENYLLRQDVFLDEHGAVLRPLQISNIGGVFLGRKRAIVDAGSFPIFNGWKNDYRIETELALRLQEEGYDLLFTPDPKFHFVHLKYGAPDNLPLNSMSYSPLGRLVNEANVPRKNTGCRVDTEQWFFDRIVSTYFVIGKRNPGAAKDYLEKMREEFVEKNALAVTGVGTKIDRRQLREKIFKKIESNGNKLILEEAV